MILEIKKERQRYIFKNELPDAISFDGEYYDLPITASNDIKITDDNGNPLKKGFYRLLKISRKNKPGYEWQSDFRNEILENGDWIIIE